MSKNVALILILVFLAACKGKPEPDKRINLIENPNIKLHDTAFDKYRNGILFSPHIIRLDNQKKAAFIQVGSAYFNMKSLDKNTREDYYKRVVATLSKDEIEAHRKVWSIHEVRDMQQGDGGNGTIVSWTKEILNETNAYYLIELKRNDVEEMGQVYGMSAFRVRLRPYSMEIADESGYFVSLESWRRTQK
jgi:hypothetical protein